jgi:hypothetical protein
LNKKGYIGPMIMVLFSVIFFVFSLIAGIVVLNSFSEELLASGGEFDSRVTDSVSDLNTRLPEALDGIILMVMGGLIIGGIVFSFFVDYSPVMFILVFIVSLSLLLGPMIMSNLYGEVVADPALHSYSTSWPITNFVMSNYAWLWFVFNTLFLFVFLVRDRFR